MIFSHDTGAGFRIYRGDVKDLRAEALTAGDAAQVAICDVALADSEFGGTETINAWKQCAHVIAGARGHR